MEIVVKEIFEKVNQTLASIGKRVKDVDFESVILSSGQIDLISWYIKDSLVILVSKSHGVFHGLSKKADSFDISFKRTDDDDSEETIGENLKSYVIDYCLFRIFSLNGLDKHMKTYYDLSDSKCNDLMYYLMKKDVPDEDSKLSGTTGSCV